MSVQSLIYVEEKSILVLIKLQSRSTMCFVYDTQKSHHRSFHPRGIAKYQRHCLTLLLHKMAITTELLL